MELIALGLDAGWLKNDARGGGLVPALEVRYGSRRIMILTSMTGLAYVTGAGGGGCRQCGYAEVSPLGRGVVRLVPKGRPRCQSCEHDPRVVASSGATRVGDQSGFLVMRTS